MVLSRVLWRPVVGAALVGSVALGLGQPGMGGAANRGGQRPKLLEIELEGDSIDFTITDPAGREAAIAIDTLWNLIPESDASRTSDDRMMEHSDDEEEPEEAKAFIPFGGGNFVISNPEPGMWLVRADARRPCPDSCELNVTILHIGELQMDFIEGVRTRLSQGDHAVMRLEVDPRSDRTGRAWARLRMEELSKAPMKEPKRSGRKLKP